MAFANVRTGIVERRAFGLIGVAMLALGLGACTTVEGTNALTDVGTFEREVMTSTLTGLGIVPKTEKADTNQRRGPLVLPKDGATAPPPGDDRRVAALPKDSDTVEIDMRGLSQEDLKRLRNARVVDLTSSSGRPLTEAESRKLTARMNGARMVNGKRPLYLPPAEYFTVVNGRETVCLARNGDIVPLNDRACPAEIRKALTK